VGGCAARSTRRGVVCGDVRCASGQVCCIDGDGRGTCGPRGLSCAGPACLSDGGGFDGGGGVACAQTTCMPDQVCCIDCSGHGSCGAPGTACPGTGCPCGGNGQPCCHATTEGVCQQGLMCCAGVPYPESGVCYDQCRAVSDRDAKRDFREVNPHEILEALATLEISTWRYKADDATVRHLGPMAQDFHARFGLGSSDRRIDMVDANGVLVAAVKALY